MKPAVLLAVVGLLMAGCAVSSQPRAVNGPTSSAGVPAGGVITVRPGDNVYKLSQRYGVSPREIIDANGLRPPYLLRPGDRLRMPGGAVHIVRSGDTVSEIAQRYGVSMRSLVVANNLRPPYLIRVGETLRLPGSRVAPPPSGVSVAARAPRMVPEPRGTAGAASGAVSGSGTAPSGGTAGKPWSGGGQLHFPTARTASQPVPPTSSSGAPLPQPRPKAIADATGSGGQTAPVVVRTSPAVAARTVSLTPPSRTGRGFAWPVRGRVVSGFGPREGGLHNDGINILAPAGSEIRAAENGIVVYAGNELRGFGNLLLIKHDGGYTTAYAHADRLLVNRGDKVQRGQVIATVGQTGNVSEPQLHFEIRKGPRPVDPRKQLPPAQVSMLVVE
ncbi:MAG: LysM peptidoglycan-binding domain-containing M23 family metallopeptidase [Alphaproteobacteria bacterium]|nr:LysM peptidoglycan-binding domain-containing M23 family metallopeptidase [Alphaproteobacteria bacterium]